MTNFTPGFNGQQSQSRPAQASPGPLSVADMALQLHKQDTESLEIAVPERARLTPLSSHDVTVIGGRLRFASLAARNQLVAEAALAALGTDLASAPSLFHAAYLLWRHEIGHEDTASGRLLAAVHAQHDVLALAAAHAPAARDVFQLLNMVGKMLAHAPKVDFQSLIALAMAQHPRTKDDLAASWFFDGAGRWLRAHPGSGAELTEVLLQAPNDATAHLLQAAWLAWAAEAPAAAAARLASLGPSAMAAAPVIGWIAGRVLADPALPVTAQDALEGWVLARFAAAAGAERQLGLQAAAQVLHLRRGLDAGLRALTDAGDPDAIAYLGLALAQNMEAFSQGQLLAQWLPRCAALPAARGRVISDLDVGLAQQLKEASRGRDVALGFLQAWIAAQPPLDCIGKEFPQLFKVCADRILQDPPLLRCVVTTWFMAESASLAEAAAALIVGLSSGLGTDWRRHGAATLAFDPQVLESASMQDLMFLGRRLIGYVIDVELLLSLALSLLELPDARSRVHPFMDSLLGDEIGYDYTGATIERLRAAEAGPIDESTRALLHGVRERLEAYIEQLDALPRLRETMVSAGLRREFRRMREKQNDQSIRAAEHESVFAQIVSKVTIKAGRSNFSYFQNSFTEQSQLNPVSWSFAMPRREALDPVGNAFRMHVNRSSKRETA